jgi:3-phosphoshikimate 1-carboxyvinyltransferase
MIAAALASGTTKLLNASFSDDSKFLATALNQIGIPWTCGTADSMILIQGGKPRKSDGEFFMGNAGTALRFFTSFVCLGSGEYEVDGEARMRERPIAAWSRRCASSAPRSATRCPTAARRSRSRRRA